MAAVAAAAITSGAAAVGLTTGVASAQPQCPDVHWIGAAGSGERAGDLTADGGMGRVIHKSYRDFAQLVARDGRTVTGKRSSTRPPRSPRTAASWTGRTS